MTAYKLERLWATIGHNIGTGGFVISKGLKYALYLPGLCKALIFDYDLS